MDAPKLTGVTAFGKHPGWNDHIEPVLGNDTPEMGQFHTQIYRQGIYENVPRWERLEENGSELLHFDHQIVTLIDDGFIIARLWRSSDGRGRKVFPLVIAAQFMGRPNSETLEAGFAALERIGAACREQSEADAVSRIANDAYTTVANAIPGSAPQPTSALNERLKDWLESVAANDYEGLIGPLKKLAKACEVRSDDEPIPTFIRVPVSDTPGILAPLAQFFAGQVPGTYGVFLAHPVGSEHLDLVVSPSQAIDWQGLRLPLKSASFAQAESSEDERRTLLSKLDDLRITGKLDTALLPPPAPSVDEDGTNSIRKVVANVRVASRELMDEAHEQRKQLPIKKIIIGLVAVIAVFIGLTFAANYRAEKVRQAQLEEERAKFRPENRAAWEDLCRAYYSWFGAFLSYKNEHKDKLKLWQADSDIGPALQAITTAKHEMDPLKIANSDKGYRSLMDTPPDEAKSKAGVEITTKALALLKALESAIITRRDAIIEKVTVTQGEYKGRVWTVDLAGEAKLNSINNADALGAKTGEHLSHLLTIDRELTDIATTWQAAGELLQAASAIESPAIQQLPAYLDAELKRAADLNTLKAKLNQQIAEDAPLSRLANFAKTAWPEVDQQALANADQAPPAPNAERFLAWIELASAYRRLKGADDPRRDLAPFETLLKAELERLQALSQQPKHSALQEEKAKIQAKYDSLMSTPPVMRYTDSIKADLKALLDAHIPAFASNIARAETNDTPAADWCRETASRSFATAAVLQAAWDARLGEPCEKLHDDLQAYAKAYKQVAVLAERLRAINERLLPLADSRELMREPLRSKLNQHLEALAESALKNPAWQQDGAWMQSYEDAHAWREQTEAKLATLASIEAAIGHAYLPDETAPGTAHSLASSLAAFTDADFAPLLDPLRTLMTKVEKLRNEDRIATLLTTCETDKEPILLRVAWQQLVTQATALGDDQLAAVQAAAESVQKQFQALPEARRNALLTELAQQLANVQNEFLVRGMRQVIKTMETSVAAFAKDYAIKAEQVAQFQADAKALQARFSAQAARAASGGEQTGQALTEIRAQIIAFQTKVEQARDPNIMLEEIAALIDAGKGLEAGVAKLYATWKSLDKPPSVRLRPILERVERLAKIAEVEPREALAIWQAAPDPKPAASVATWRALQGTDWPKNMREVEQEFELRAAVGTFVDQKELTQTLPARWNKLAQALPARELPFERIADFKVNPKDLSPEVQLAYILWQENGTDLSKLDDDQVLARRDALIRSIRQAIPAPPPELLSKLQALQKDEQASAAPTNAGPAMTPFRHEIPLVSHASDTAQLDYRWQVDGESYTISFLRIDPPGQKSFYLSRHEFSVGLARAVLKKADPTVKSNLFQDIGQPSFQVWEGLASGDLEVAPSWHTDNDSLKVLGPSSSKPTHHSPMQNVDINTATYLANILGCRLPTEAEWRLALARTGAARPRANLRDLSWKRFREGLKAANLDTDSRWAMWPLDGSALNDYDLDSLAVDTDDQIPFLAEVTAGDNGGFCHLIGNVAEFVTVNAHEPSMPPSFKAIPVDSAFFIGGSAMSPKEPAPESRNKLEDMNRATDLGFRLAFTAPKQHLRDQYQRIISAK